ncbi:hypothetical protein BJX76DRAFT_212116 [Aspergillus varians]
MTTHSGIQRTPSHTDLGKIWEQAIQRYNQATGTRIESLAKARNLEEVLNEIQDKRTVFGRRRHGNSKSDRFRSLVAKALLPIEKLSEIVAQGTSNVFPPAVAIFTAVRFLIVVRCLRSHYDCDHG